MDPAWGLIDARRIRSRGDAAVAALAAAQHGVVTSGQLAYAGLSPSAIATRRRRGSVHPLHRGVVAVGHAGLTDLGRVAAAVLACGPGSLASNRASGFLLGGLELDQGPIDISVIAVGRRSRPGIRVHQCPSLTRRDRSSRQRIPHTSPARTVLDVAENEGAESAQRLLNHLRTRRRVTRDDFADLYRRTVGRRGWRPLLPLIREQGYSRSKAEEAMKRLLTKAGLAKPLRNVRVHGHELDFWWPDLRLNVEIDGYGWHSARNDLNRDRGRDIDLASVGIQVLRISRDQLKFQPELVIARLAAAMALAARHLER